MANTHTGNVRGRRIQWMVINAALLAIPLAIYFFFYANLRETQIHERNFRALDAAANRITSLMENIPNAAQFLTLPGLEFDDLNLPNATEVNKQQLNASLREYFRTTAMFGGEERALDLDAQINTQLAALGWTPQNGDFAIPGLVYSQVDYARERSFIPEAPLFSARLFSPVRDPTSFVKLLNESSKRIDDVPYAANCEGDDVQKPVVSRITRLQRQVLTFDLCEPPGSGASAESALKSFLNLFRVQLEIPVSELVKGVLPLLSTSFDDVLILNEAGTVLYRAGNDTDSNIFDTPLVGNDEIGQVSESFVAFQSFDVENPETGQTPATGRFASARDNVDAAVGQHSRRVQFTIGGRALVAYAHPFAVGSIAVPGNAAENDEDEAEAAPKERVWYVVGITTREAITGASTELRLRTINLTMLMMATLISAFIFIWLRTNGKRALLLPHHLLITVLSGAVALSLTVTLAQLIYRDIIYRQQGEREISQVAEELKGSFNREIIDKACYFNVILDGSDSCESRAIEIPSQQFPPFEMMLQLDSEGNARTASITKADPPPAEEAEANSPAPVEPTASKTTILSNRIYKVAAASLAFRNYFLEPRAGNLFRFTDGDRAAEVFIERITSVLDGTVETVISAPAKMVNANHTSEDIIASIIHLDSFDDAVLLHPYRFAVINSESGMTLYHSLKERSLVTNFLQDIEPSEALMEALRWNHSRTLDLVYAGNPVMAHVMPLAQGLPWTLVVYRDHETRDTADTIATLCTIGVAGFVGLLLMLLVATVPWLSRFLIDVLWEFCGASRTTALGKTNAMLLASMLAYLILLVTPVPVWITAPLCILTTAAILLRRRDLVKVARHETDKEPSRFKLFSGQNVFLSVVLILFFVLPAMQLFEHFTRVIDDQLLTYRYKETISALTRRCNNLQQLVRRYDTDFEPAAIGDYLAPTDDYGLITLNGPPLSCTQPVQEFELREDSSFAGNVIGAIGGFSPTAAAITNNAAELSVLSQAGTPRFELPEILKLPRLLFALVVSLALLLFVVKTLKSHILHISKKPHQLPEWKNTELKFDIERPWYLVIDQSRNGFDDFVDYCREERIVIQQLCKSGDAKVEWKPLQEPSDSQARRTVYVVREVEYFSSRELALCAELHELMRKQKKPIVVFTRVIPTHWLKSRAEDIGDRKHRLLRVLADFRSYHAPARENRFVLELIDHELYDKEDRIQQLLEKEAACFPELAPSIARVYIDADRANYTIHDYLEAIKLCCGVYFRRLWEVSSHEEQLQLYALSRGGFVNPALHSAINSLAARGLVEIDGRTRMRSAALAYFIARELDHEDLNQWIKEDRQRLWTLVWQPISIVVALGLAFVFVSTPDRLNSITAILVSAVGAMPILTTLMSGLRSVATTGGGADKTA